MEFSDNKSDQSMIWASAISRHHQALAAVDHCCREIKACMHGEDPDISFVFIHPAFGPNYEAILEIFEQMLKPGHLLGGTAGGVIGAGREIEGQPAMSVLACRLPRVQITPFCVDADGMPGPDEGPAAWEKTLGVRVSRKPQFVLLASPGMRNIESLLEGLDYAYPNAKKVGGLASGLSTGNEPCLFYGTEVRARGAIGLALSGDIHLDTLVAQGCRPVGPVMSVSQCQGNLLTHVDGKKTVDVLTALFEGASDKDKALMNTSLFLGVVMDPFKQGEPKPGDFLVRTVLGIDPESKAVAVGALLRQGQRMQFHVRDSKAAHQDLQGMLNSFKADNTQIKLRGALLFSCLGRGEQMYGEAHHDSQLLENTLGHMPLGGFFCNGEIGPVAKNTYVHGFTSSFALFSPARSED